MVKGKNKKGETKKCQKGETKERKKQEREG